jgi:hypothetical protein
MRKNLQLSPSTTIRQNAKGPQSKSGGLFLGGGEKLDIYIKRAPDGALFIT